MIIIKPTKNLTGITIQGDIEDLSNLVDSIYRLTTEDRFNKDLHYGVKCVLLSTCYDIRHAYYGDRDTVLIDNAISKDVYKLHNIKGCNKNIYYSVNILFPIALFLAASIPQLYFSSAGFYGKKSRRKNKPEHFPSFLYTDYIKDKANLDVLCAGIWQALGQVIGDDQLQEIIRLLEKTDESYFDYNIHFIDRCSSELLVTDVEKRNKKLKSIARRLIVKSKEYYNLEEEYKYWANYYNTTIYELSDSGGIFYDEIEW